MDYNDQSNTHSARISPRILRHLIREASDLLEEAQTHALVEKQTGSTTSALSQTNWRLTATCLWATGELFPGSGEREQAAQLHAPLPIFAQPKNTLSPQLENFVQRVDRLHERARRLDDLSHGPMVSTEDSTDNKTPVAEEPRESAAIIPLFGKTCAADTAENPVAQAHSQVRWAMAGLE